MLAEATFITKMDTTFLALMIPVVVVIIGFWELLPFSLRLSSSKKVGQRLKFFSQKFLNPFSPFRKLTFGPLRCGGGLPVGSDLTKYRIDRTFFFPYSAILSLARQPLKAAPHMLVRDYTLPTREPPCGSTTGSRTSLQGTRIKIK